MNFPELTYEEQQQAHYDYIKMLNKRESHSNDFVKESVTTQKNMLSLIEPTFIIEMGKVLTMGANKYSIDNWKKCKDTRVYKDALLRHLYDYLAGESTDSESKLSHLAHVAVNAMFLYTLEKAADALNTK